jgi:hypothetical protein
LNFFAMGGNGRFHIVAAFSVLGVTWLTHVSSPITVLLISCSRWISLTYQMHEHHSHMMNCVIICDLLGSPPPVCTLFCNGVGCGCCCGFYPTPCLTLWQYESAWCVCLPCEGIYMTYKIIHGGHVLANRLVLLVSTCIPIFEISAPNPQLFLWH